MKNTRPRDHLQNVDLGKLGIELEKYENQWIAISSDNKIVANGRTYGETLDKLNETPAVVLYKVPPLGASLAP